MLKQFCIRWSIDKCFWLCCLELRYSRLFVRATDIVLAVDKDNNDAGFGGNHEYDRNMICIVVKCIVESRNHGQRQHLNSEPYLVVMYRYQVL